MPIGRITRVARDIQATDLSRRIGLLGPNDDLKQLADTFDAMLDRLQRAFDNQQRLIHDTSHELRNPLAVMRTNLDVTLSDPDANLEQYQRTTEVVRRSTERMSKLVDDLLAYARHEATTRVEGPVDLSELVIMLVDEFEGAAEHEQLHLRLDVAPGLRVVGHERSLEQAIANLLANAVRFAPEGSDIVVSAGADSGWVWLTVADEGPGVAPDERERVFQRYVRLGEGEAGRPHLAGGEGSGLGLAIVREIVQAHRGEVSIIETAVGATFALWIPEQIEVEMTGEFRLRRTKRRATVAG
jgi:signal transduction histidine kinase